MKVLLDSQALLRAAYVPERLPQKVRSIIEDEENQLVVSHASLWELLRNL